MNNDVSYSPSGKSTPSLTRKHIKKDMREKKPKTATLDYPAIFDQFSNNRNHFTFCNPHYLTAFWNLDICTPYKDVAATVQKDGGSTSSAGGYCIFKLQGADMMVCHIHCNPHCCVNSF